MDMRPVKIQTVISIAKKNRGKNERRPAAPLRDM